MVKRVVDTKFWSSMDVLDNYSVEDKFFALYLMTNGRSSQVGIYSLPKKIISFETGFTKEVIEVLLDRFSNQYKQIIYSENTQEVTLLTSLQYSILKGGKPVSDLLERELRNIQDGKLILETYRTMTDFWKTSKRKFDQTIQLLFEDELINRELISACNKNDNGIQNKMRNENNNQNNNKNINQSHVNKKNENRNDNDNEESLGRNRSTNRGTNHKNLINSDDSNPDESIVIERYIQYLKYKKPDFNDEINIDEVIYVFYEELLGEITLEVKEKLTAWESKLPKSVILEAFTRSIDKFRPIYYITTIIENWLNQGVTNLRDVSRLDREFNREKE